MEAKYAPIIVPTLNRHAHLKRCVESLSRCTLADCTELVIGLDFPPSEKYRDGYEKILEYLPKITGFKNVTVLRHEKNLGTIGNIQALLTYAKKDYDCFICTEDDNEFAPNFLEYVNWGLTKYKDDISVFAICGFKDIYTDDIKNNVYKLNTIFCAWGYGSWFDRFEKLYTYHDRQIFKQIVNNAGVSSVFSEDIVRLSSMVYQLARNTFYGDMIVSLLPENEKWCIFPKKNEVRNWGWDGTGTHGGSLDTFKKYSTLPMDTDEHFVPVIVEDLYNPVVYERFKKHYKTSKKTYIRAAIIFLCYKLTGYIPVSNKKSRWCKVKLLKVQ